MLIGQVLVVGKLRDGPGRSRQAKNLAKLGVMLRHQPHFRVSTGEEDPSIEMMKTGEVEKPGDAVFLVRSIPLQKALSITG